MTMLKPQQHQSSSTQQQAALTAVQIKSAVARAVRFISPLWSLQHFVAVNPFLGLTDQSFDNAALLLARRAGARLTAPRSFFAAAIRSGRISDPDLEAALADNELPEAPQTVAALKAFAQQESGAQAGMELLPTVADLAAELTGKEWGEFVTESISSWAASYFDQGQAYWKSPWRDLPAFNAWQAEAALDRTPEIAGIAQFRRLVDNLHRAPQEVIEEVLKRLGVPAAGLEAYLHRLLLTISGWAGYARYHLWEAELRGRGDTTIDDLLAIRLVWEVALLDQFGAAGLTAAWKRQREAYTAVPSPGAELSGDLLLQAAFETAYQRRLMTDLANHAPPAAERVRPDVQAAFCIDVRSELFRRALESVSDGVDTIGFAGFFGFPIEYVPLGQKQGGAQCPALLVPQFVIREAVQDAAESEEAEVVKKRTLRQRAIKVWRTFKFGAVACFGFVGPVGLVYLKKLVTDSLGKTRPVSPPAEAGLDNDILSRLGPRLTTGEAHGRQTGMTPAQQLEVAAGMLRAMSLTDNFARLVVLTGHGSTTVNNPYASGLDCGACGGHAGEANARVAALVLNDAAVRAGLADQGIVIPEDTVFVAAQHDTTTDAVTIFDRSRIPATHAGDLVRLEGQLAAAGTIARAERAPLLGLDGEADIDKAVMKRSRDWSQVRPEWGLAGCAAFIVAPRQQTAGVDLHGRSFLHNYDWRQDSDFSVLELIMTAPMVVASWINLQYYGSTVDNRIFGSGNKVLHNVVSALGVLEGNGGDIRSGLPWQSVHDGERFIHEPLRLNVLIAAPREGMNAIIEKHEAVRQLLDNRWIFLFTLDDTGSVTHQYNGDLNWRTVPAV